MNLTPPSEATRAYLYRLALAILSLLAIYGVVQGDDVDGIARVVEALLGIGAAGLAAANTSTKA